MTAGVAEACLGNVNYIWLKLGLLFVTQPPTLQGFGAEIFYHNVRLHDQSLDQVQALFRTQVNSDAFLVGIGVVEVCPGIEVGSYPRSRASSSPSPFR